MASRINRNDWAGFIDDKNRTQRDRNSKSCAPLTLSATPKCIKRNHGYMRVIKVAFGGGQRRLSSEFTF